MAEKGHDANDCYIFKVRVQNLLDRGILSFKDFESNIQRNPLLGHAQNIGVIDVVKSKMTLFGNNSEGLL